MAEITIAEENHSEVITHKGEATMRYAEAITSSEYQSISIENLDQANVEEHDERESNTENSLEIQPPPYSRE